MRVASTVLTAALLLTGAAATIAPAQASTAAPAVYFIPHQDDEVLTFGPSIEAHVRAGRDVHLVLLTDGGASGVRTILARQGISLTRSQFSEARDRELLDSAERLGVPADHVHFEGLLDAQTTVPQMRAVIGRWMDRYPDGSFKGMTPKDANIDHSNSGRALQAECAARVGSDCRFLQFRNYWSTMPMSGWYDRGGSGTVSAAAAYLDWDPANGRYAIGWRSVAYAFRALFANPLSKTSVTG